MHYLIEEKLLKDHEEKLNKETSEEKVEQVKEPVNESVEVSPTFGP